MAAGKRNVTIEQYARYYEEFVVSDNGVIRNITGSTIKMQLKRKTSDASPAFSYAVGSGITLEDPTNGKFSIAIGPSDTSTMSGVYRYDITIDSGSGADRLLEGDIIISEGVTH